MSNEPQPQARGLPESRDFPIRVGLVLPEDNKSKIVLRIPSQSYIAHGEGRDIPLEAGQLYIIENKDGAVRLSGKSVNNILVTRDTISLAPSSPVPLRPQSGLPIQGIRAGRGFHWEKEIVEIFPGSFEFRASGNFLTALNILPFEEYISCVAVSEMSNECPAEFLKAQTIAARSWAYAFLGVKYPGKPYDVCNDDMSQRYQGTTFLTEAALAAVQETAGQYVCTPQHQVCAAYYSKMCGGRTETPEAAYGFSVPGLQSVFDGKGESECSQLRIDSEENLAIFLQSTTIADDASCGYQARHPHDAARYLGSVDVSHDYFRWTYMCSPEELLETMQKKGILLRASRILTLEVLRRGASGRALELAVRYEDRQGEQKEHLLASQFDIRKYLHNSFLFSSQFILSRDERGNFVFSGGGWGHAVGFCQIGALSMALEGQKAAQILKHYFPTCDIGRVEK